MIPTEPRLKSQLNRSPASLSLWIASTLWVGLLAGILWAFTADDSYIVYRYATNFSSGRGLVYNPSEHISALTSPLHAIICCLLVFLPLSIVTSNKILALVFIVTASAVACRRLEYGPFRCLLVAGLVLGSPHVVFWAVGGLETPYLLSLLMVVFWQHDSFRRSPSRRSGIVLSVTCGLCFLLRFDSVLLSGPILVHAIILGRRRGLSFLNASIALIGPAMLISASWLTFSHLYYHDILPTSYYSKGLTFSWFSIATNAIYILQFLVLSGLAVVASVIALVILIRADRGFAATVRNWTGRHWGLLTGLVLSLIYSLGMVTTHMMFSYRFLVPFLPLLLLLFIDLYPRRDLQRRPCSPHAIISSGLAILLLQATVLAALLTASFNIGAVGEYRRVDLPQYQQFQQVLKEQAICIRDHWSRQDGRAGGPIVYVFAAGVPGHELADARIVDSSIISYRHYYQGRPSGISQSADYVWVTSRHGSLATQLRGLLGGLDRLDSSAHSISFDGTVEEFVVYFNPHPSELRLPPYIDGSPPASSTDGNSIQ